MSRPLVAFTNWVQTLGWLVKQHPRWLKRLDSKLFAQGETDLEFLGKDHGSQLTNLQMKAAMLTTQIETLSKQCKDLKGHSRNNVWLLDFPEGTEGLCPTEFVTQFLLDLLRQDSKPVLDWAHRSLHPRPKDGEPPWL